MSHRRRRAGRTALAVGHAALVAALAAPADAQVGRFRPDDWVTLTDFRFVEAVAVSSAVAYLGTTAGLERFDTLGGRWLPPITAADGLPHPRVTALAVDPVGDDAWIGTARGLVRLSGFVGEVERVYGPPPTVVDEIRIDPRDGTVYARVASVWWSGRGGSPVLERSGPPPASAEGSIEVDEVDPFALPWTDPLYVDSEVVEARLFRLTELDRDQRGDWYVGTWGDNGRRWGAGRASWEPLRYGLAGPAGGPIARASDGTWFVPGPERSIGSSDADAPPALAFAADSGAWSYVVARTTPGLAAATGRAAVAVGDTLYLGTDLGLARGAGGAWTSWGPTSDGWRGPVAALAVDGDRLWVGADRGLVAWDRAREGPVRSYLRGARVTALAIAPDAVFVGTEAGLHVGERAPGALPADLVRVEGARGTVTALALHAGLLVVGDDAGLGIFDRATGDWRRQVAGTDRLPSAPLALAADAEGVWIGTREGLVRWRPAGDRWDRYGPADGLAGPRVQHLLAEPGAVWASTPDGVSRFGWREARR